MASISLTPYICDVDGKPSKRLHELPVVHSIQEAKNVIMNLPRHLQAEHVEYVEEPSPEGDTASQTEEQQGVRGCEGLDDFVM